MECGAAPPGPLGQTGAGTGGLYVQNVLISTESLKAVEDSGLITEVTSSVLEISSGEFPSVIVKLDFCSRGLR